MVVWVGLWPIEEGFVGGDDPDVNTAEPVKVTVTAGEVLTVEGYCYLTEQIPNP